MRKATEASAGDDKAGIVLTFQQIAKDELRQENVHDFISHTTDGDYITLIGSKVELITLELANKATLQMSSPYVVSSFKCLPKNRPSDKLAQKVNLDKIYASSNAMEKQHFSLEPVYTGIATGDSPDSSLVAAKWSHHLLPNGQMLLALLTSYGSLELISKNAQYPFWQHYEQYDISATLRDELHPPFEVPADKINTFRQFQAYVDRSWITMFDWRPLKSDSGNYVLVLGTAVGSLWTLTLSPDAQTVLSYCELHTMLDRICYMQVFEDLLLVGDNSGLVHLYRFDETAEEGLELVKPLWLRPDHMALEQAVITHCTERNCYYIAICKAAHLLIWCMPRKGDNWLETRLLVGGMKISALCSLDNSSYALATARGPMYRIEITHKSAQLSVSKQHIAIEESENFRAVGLFCSPHKNLLTVLFTPTKDFLVDHATRTRPQLVVCVGKLGKVDALAQLAELLSPNEPINSCKDLLSDVRVQIFSHVDLDKFLNYAPFDMFAFDALATQAELQRLQLKYHVLDALHHGQQHQPHDYSEKEMQLLLAMLATTHIRLRLQYLASLKELTAFQRKSSHCLLRESVRIREHLEQQLKKEQPLNVTIKRFLAQIEVHFDALQKKLGEPPALDVQQEPKRCNISYVELVPDLESHYCTFCGRQALLERQLLLELYEPGSRLLCPCCHGAYIVELYDAST